MENKKLYPTQRTWFDTFHILRNDRQLRIFENSKHEIYLELSEYPGESSIGISLSGVEARELYARLESLILKMPFK